MPTRPPPEMRPGGGLGGGWLLALVAAGSLAMAIVTMTDAVRAPETPPSCGARS